jgi:AAA+ superfamily predicted ATPase
MGGLIVIRIQKHETAASEYMVGKMSRAFEVCRIAAECRNHVITIFSFPRDSKKTQEDFFEHLDGVSLVKIQEKLLFDDDAKKVIRSFARNHSVCGTNETRALVRRIVAKTGYSVKDIRLIFDKWYDNYLKEKAFPQYSKDVKTYSLAKKGAVGSGVEKLNALIGLSETKALVSNIIDFAKAQELFTADCSRKKQSMHMVFSGNPGSAKTTVARIMAQILKENKILHNGDLVEVGRADLVGQYVGSTAPAVRRAFKRAAGSVLFIDEAYSLVDHHSGLFGDEAINTIVQEMENRRDDMVVIFAGYPDKMEVFLSRNPGLRSRISFHVNFPDYLPADLYEILEHLAREEGIILANDVRERVFPIMEHAAKIKEFGNGRYARNLLENARMCQASRLVRLCRESEHVTEQAYATLVAEDFEEIRLAATACDCRRIGFG